MADSLPDGGARTLARWSDIRVSPGQNLLVFAVAFSYGPVTVLWLGAHDWSTFILWSMAIGAVLLPVFRFGATGILEWVFRRSDSYREYGQSGFALIYAIQDSGVLQSRGRMNLRQMDTAIRAAHAWRRLGKANGVDKTWRSQRVFELLAQSPLDSAGALEICALMRSSLVETVSPRIDPFTYQERKGLWREDWRFERANSLMTLVGAAIGLLAVILPVLLSR
jgi:hypothetical protein